MGPTTPDSVQDWSQTSNSSTQTTNLEPCNPYPAHSQRTPTRTNQVQTWYQQQHGWPHRQATLYDWIKPHLPDRVKNNNPHSTANKANPQTNNKPPAKKHKHPQLHRHNKQLITQHTDNNHWGDILSSSNKIFRVASKNVNTVSSDDNLIQWRGVTDDMTSLCINSFTIQEPNTKWNDHLTQCIDRIFRQTFRQSAFSTSTGGLVQSVSTVYCVDGAGGSTPPWRVLAIWLVS